MTDDRHSSASTRHPAHVFEARSSLRPRVFRLVGLISAMAVLAILVIFVDAVRDVGRLPVMERADRPLTVLPAEPATAVPGVELVQWTWDDEGEALCEGPAPTGEGRRVAAFLPADDPAARASLAQNCGRIDLILADTYRLADWEGSVEVTPIAPEVLPRDRALPVLDLSLPDGETADTEAATRLADAAFLSALATRLTLVDGETGTGLCLDLTRHGGLPGETVRIAAVALARGGRTCVIGAAEAAFWEDAALVDALDVAVVKAFRAAQGPADPPAPTGWFDAVTARAEALIPADKLFIALGTRGQVWRSGRSGLLGTDYARAMTTLAEDGADVWFVPWANAARARYVGPDGVLTEVWLPDALSMATELAAIEAGSAVALWPLGSEDPSVWAVLDGAAPDRPVTLTRPTLVQGRGSAVVDAVLPLPGERVIERDPATGAVVAARYATLPEPARLIRSGDDEGRGDVALTFQQLPPAEQWPALETTLASLGIEATFMVETWNLLDNATVAESATRAGHVIGLQMGGSATGLPLGQASDRFRQLLLIENTGARARLAQMTGSGNLVRDARALLDAGFIPLMPVEATVLDGADLADRPRADLETTGRLAIDVPARGWRSAIDDLPALAAGLVQDGYRLSSLHRELKLTTADLMPSVSQLPNQTIGLVFAALGFVHDELNTIFFWFLGYSALRSILYFVLALVRRPKDAFDADWTPPVSILIPAYNEAVVIDSCVASILEAPYPDLRVIVIDDGSTDRTFETVDWAWGDDPRVKVVSQPNGGKWAAANRGLQEVDTPFFLIADADSIFTPDTIHWLMQQFKDERVGAVAGLVEVGNRGTLLGKCQSLEYIVSQAVMRRAQEVYEGILVVPGAVGAWRTEAVRKAGLFSGETVTEDADLTVAVHRAGYKVRFQEQARSVTEAPEGVGPFMRQRVRWTFGMLQTAWKHGGAIREGRSVGVVSIIDAIWFGVASTIFAPLVDLLFLLLIGQGLWALATGGTAMLASIPMAFVIAYFALTFLDVANTLLAFRFEKRVDWGLLMLVPFLRFGYRQLLYVATLKAIWQALSGTAAGWNKLARTGKRLSLWSPGLAAAPAGSAG